MMIYFELLKEVWNSIYDPQKEVIDTINKYFHQDYEQSINGMIMNRSEYIQHVLEQRKNMTIDSIHYVQFLEKGHELFAIYYPSGRNINNLPIEAEVIAYFSFKDGKILRIHGLVRLMKGDLRDVDMINDSN